ncbi:MAG: carbon monoxide dehydrogenase subunit G [Pseudomonadota bacterium]
MQVEGEYTLHATRDVVWQKLNDPAVLRQCIPGCESLEAAGQDTFKAVVKAAIGPVKATFNADIALEDLSPPEHYTISGNAKSGAAGFGKGSAKVCLHEDPAGTRLTYAADLKVGGKLAQIGSRMVVGATRKTADDFFDAFATVVNGPTPADAFAQDNNATDARSKTPTWVYALVAAVVAFLVAFLA